MSSLEPNPSPGAAEVGVVSSSAAGNPGDGAEGVVVEGAAKAMLGFDALDVLGDMLP